MLVLSFTFHPTRADSPCGTGQATSDRGPSHLLKCYSGSKVLLAVNNLFVLLCLAYKWRDGHCFLFQFCLCVLEGGVGMGLREAPMAVLFAELALGNIGRRKCPGAGGGLHLALVCPCWLSHGAALKKFPQVLLFLPRASLLTIGCRAGSAGFWAGYRAAMTSGEAKAQRY